LRDKLPARSTSIKDIAEAANVSSSTVSRALAGSALISTETADRVRAIARERGFHVSAAARSLVTGRTNIIGLVVVTLADPFIGEVAEAVDAAAQSRGYSVMLGSSGADPDQELRVLRDLEERRVAGAVVSASHVGDAYLARLEQMKVPMVLLNSHRIGEAICSVRIDNVTAAEAATRYLRHLGHERIAYLGHRFGYQSEEERRLGFLRAMNAPAEPIVAYGDSTAEGGVRAMEELLARPATERPSAVFCYNDVSAFGALHATRRAGLRVPDDVSIVGFDDLPLASYANPPLTTVRQPRREMGRIAMDALFTLIGGGTPDASTLVRGELIVRDSSAPPSRRRDV
jgi:DNA-binding LacI/PurR family transcriptional regulator